MRETPSCDYCNEDLRDWYDAMTKEVEHPIMGRLRRRMCSNCYEIHGDKAADNDHYLIGNDGSFHLVGAIH